MKIQVLLEDQVRVKMLVAALAAVEKIYNKQNSGLDSATKQAVTNSIMHGFSKHGASLQVALDAVEKVLSRRKRKSGNYSDLSRAQEALRQSLTVQLKKLESVK